MSTLAQIDYEREEFCRFDDYGRYNKHLSRKLHTLRKASDKKMDILLFSAERAWSNAMQNKAVNGKIQFTLNKLRKACKHAKELTDAYASGDADARLQATIYQDYLQGTLSQERGAYDDAILHNSRALIALQNQNSSLMEAVETGLRFSIYQSGAEERSINLQKFALEQVAVDESQDDWRALVNEVRPTSLNEEKGEEMITSIQWASRSAHLTNPDLASAISTAVSGRSSLSEKSAPNDFDSILAAWTTASTTIDGLLEKEEDQNISQDLELIKAWMSYHASLDRIARDKALIQTVSPKEGVLLCDAINKSYTQVLALPGLDSVQSATLDRQRREVRGERCVLLSTTHGTSLEQIALVNRALTYFDDEAPRKQELNRFLNQVVAQYTLSSSSASAGASLPVPAVWFSGRAKDIAAFDPSSLRSTSVTMKPVVFDIAWNYITAQQNNGSVAKSTATAAVSDKMEVDAMPAANAVTSSSSSSQTTTTTPKKGLFGGLFGR